MRASRLAALLGLLLLSAPVFPGASGGELFFDDFELGDYCAWSAFGECTDVGPIIDRLTGSYELCLSPLQLLSGTVHVCEASLCANNAPGCAVSLEIADASLDRITGAATFDATIAPFDMDVAYSALGCTLSAAAMPLAGSLQATFEPLCSTTVDRVADVQVIDLVYSYDISGCGVLGPVLNVALPVVESEIDAFLSTRVEELAAEAVAGAALCPP